MWTRRKLFSCGFLDMWVSGHVGVRRNEAAGRAAKEVLDKEPTGDLMPPFFLDLDRQIFAPSLADRVE